MKKYFLYGFLFILIVIISIESLFINKKDTVAIIGAMDTEISEIENNLSNIKHSQFADFKIITGNIGDSKIILSKSGVGKVNASTTTQFIIDRYKPNYIINIGVAGGVSSDLKAGDIVIAEKMLQHDFDLTALGCSKGYMNDGDAPEKPTIYSSDEVLVEKFNKDKKYAKGTIATGDIFITDLNLKKNINKEFGADIIDMESAAIAQTSKRNNTSVIIMRIISDGLNDATNEYKQNKESLANKLALLVVAVLKYQS